MSSQIPDSNSNLSEIEVHNQSVQVNEQEIVSSQSNSGNSPISMPNSSLDYDKMDSDDIYNFIAGQRNHSEKYEDIIEMVPLLPVSTDKSHISSQVSDSKYTCTRSEARYLKPNCYKYNKQNYQLLLYWY